MIAVRKYRRFTAVVLLAVYAFIATPVSYWHHHNYKADPTGYSATLKNAKTVLSIQGAKVSEVNCEVCSHHYSFYGDGSTLIFEEPLFYPSAKHAHLSISIPSYPHPGLSNKGPPAIG